MTRYRTLAAHWRRRFGLRVQRIPLDIPGDVSHDLPEAARGHTLSSPRGQGSGACPNRDGTVSTRGCVFCNPQGSGSGLGLAGKSIEEQWDRWVKIFSRKYGPCGWAAYPQSFSNTAGSLEDLQKLLQSLHKLPGMRVLCLGTRPDCLDTAKCALLAEASTSLEHGGEVWLDLGLQSAHDATLRRINRGHTAADFVRAARLARAHGLKVCAHLMLGLPDEGAEEALQTVAFVNKTGVDGVKFHNTLVLDRTELAAWWRSGDYLPWGREPYVRTLGDCLARLDPAVVVHRVNADPLPGELLAPAWAADKRALLDDIREDLERRDLWQGKALGHPLSALRGAGDG